MKNRIAEVFKELAKKNRMEKISIRSITTAAHINHSTFYYHFKDKSDLVEWIFFEDIVKNFVKPINDDWTFNVIHLLETFRNNRGFYKQVLNLDSYHNLQKFLHDVTRKTTRIYIDDVLQSRKLDTFEKNFLIEFISAGYVETYINYLRGDCQEDPQKLVQIYKDLTIPAIKCFIEKNSTVN